MLKDRTGTFEVGTRIDNPIADMWLKNIDENAKTLNIDYSASINNATDQLIEEAERAKIVAKEIVALVKMQSKYIEAVSFKAVLVPIPVSSKILLFIDNWSIVLLIVIAFVSHLLNLL